MEVDDEVLERKARLNKIIDQGSKVEQLYNQEEFQFFLGWIDRLRDELKNSILKGELLDDKKEWHAKGGYAYLTKVIEGAELFADKAKKARNALKKLDQDLKDAE